MKGYSAANKRVTKLEHREHVVRTVHKTLRMHVDKDATIDKHLTIHYTHYITKKSGTIPYEEAERIFRDLYGEPKERWSVSKQHLELCTKFKKLARQKHMSISEIRKRYLNSGQFTRE